MIKKKAYEFVIDYGPVGRKSRFFIRHDKVGYQVFETECEKKEGNKYYWIKYWIANVDTREEAVKSCKGYV